MRDKLLFVIPEHTHGGTNRSLHNLISLLDKRKYEIFIYCLVRGGLYENYFSDYEVSQGRLIKFWFSKYFFFRILRKIDIYISYKLSSYIFNRECKRLVKTRQYNSVISFQEGLATRFTSYFKDVRLIAWVQCDYSYYFKNLNHPFDLEKRYYHVYDKIACVSECTAKVMRDFFPDLSERIVCAYNTLDIKMTKSLSEERIDDDRYDYSTFTIVSIGRFNWVKRFDIIPEIVNEIRQEIPDVCFKWYVIADGETEKCKTEESIKKYGVEDFVILLGVKNNPYPYIKHANLLVCLSIVESWSYVLNEAMLLHVPVVSTNFDAAYEVVDDSVGMVVTIEDIPSALCRLISNKGKCYTKLKKGSEKFEYSNEKSLAQVEQILDFPN